MSIERLSFADEGSYSGLEASIHIARYALARNCCQGRRVLDLACGEGYGSRLMLDWGAAEVVGVDVSEESVTNAQAKFGRDGLRFLTGDAEKVDELLPGEQFDLIISLETIEHLNNPVAYLQALTRLRASESVLLISCPNDWWYYPEAHQRNPHHVRKYSSEEFLALVTPILGKPDAVGLGVPIVGFINLRMEALVKPREQLSQIAMMESAEHKNTVVVPAEPSSVSARNSSYFVARWGDGGNPIDGAAMLPVPMDVFRNGMYSGNANRDLRTSAIIGGGLELISAFRTALREFLGVSEICNDALFGKCDNLAELVNGHWQRFFEATFQDRLDHSRQEFARRENDIRKECEKGIASCRNEIANLKLLLQSERVRGAAILVENEVMRKNVSALQAENIRVNNELAIGSIAAYRYFRLRSLVPEFVLAPGRRLRDVIRKIG